MKKYKCTVCGMEINENNYNFNKDAFMEENEQHNINYCPFCGAEREYIVEKVSFKAQTNEKLDDRALSILDHASKLEVFNSDFYAKAAELAQSDSVRNKFKALSNIELMHARIHIRLTGISKLPILKDMDYSKYNEDAVLLKMASEREKHAVEFYNKYIHMIESEEIKNIMRALSKVEKQHIILTGGSI